MVAAKRAAEPQQHQPEPEPEPEDEAEEGAEGGDSKPAEPGVSAVVVLLASVCSHAVWWWCFVIRARGSDQHSTSCAQKELLHALAASSHPSVSAPPPSRVIHTHTHTHIHNTPTHTVRRVVPGASEELVAPRKRAPKAAPKHVTELPVIPNYEYQLPTVGAASDKAASGGNNLSADELKVGVCVWGPCSC